MMRFAVGSALVLAVAAIGFAAEGDWTKWRGPKGDCTTTEKGLLEQWPEAGPKELWRKEVGQGYASPVAVEGKIYIFATADGKDTLTCLDAEKGDVLWAQKNEKGYVEKQFPGTRATPTVDGDKIYTFGGYADLVCRELKDGKEVWTLDVPKELAAKRPYWGAASCPTVIGDFVYLQVGEKAGKEGAVPPLVIAVNKTTGKITWQSEEKGAGSYAAVVQAEVGGEKHMLAFGAKGVVAMSPATGKTAWKQEWTGTYDIEAVSPIVKDGYMFITSGYEIGCAMYKVDGKTVEKVWQKKEPHDRLVPPLLEGDKMYITSDEGSLRCMKWPSGEELWKQDLKLGTGGQYVRFGDKMIMMSNKGELMLVQATPEGCKPISTVQLFKGEENWSSPMVYRGKLYVKGPKELVCFDVKVAK